ncbi:MAG: metallophosphoesterase [Methylococcales bacterium]|nr:metallophosphoesterase [Methylococcales bacterium]
MNLFSKKLTRRGWLLRSPFLAAGGAFAYGSLFERLHISVEHVSMPIPAKYAHLDGFRIAFMADFHFDDYGNQKMLGRAVKAINDESVDLVLLGGDYVSRDPSQLEPLAEVLQDLRATLGVFGIKGNHEYHYPGNKAEKVLGDKGVRFLVNAVEEFEDFSLIGQDSAWEGVPFLKGGLHQAPQDKPIILGWHEPDTFDFHDDQRIVLQLSGHSHGGQVCAPFIGPILLPHLAKKYTAGLYRDGDRNLYVTRGIGTLTVPARFMCPPEVTILKLTKS